MSILGRCKEARASGSIPSDLLTLAEQLTEANAAIFDVANRFAGCIPGINEVLRRDGLLETRRCLDPSEELSTGQSELIRSVADRFKESLRH